MSVFFSSEPTPGDPQLAELWYLLANEDFRGAVGLAEGICQDTNAPIEFFCGLSLAYGETGYYEDAERVARLATGFGETNWRARHALAVALMHQGRFLGALDSLGFYRTPPEIYIVRAQVEKMGDYPDGLHVTLEDALDIDVPPAIKLYLGYLFGTLDASHQRAGFAQAVSYGGYLDVWERDAMRHRGTPYGQALSRHLEDIRQIL